MPVVLPKKTIEIFGQAKTHAEYKKIVFDILGDLKELEVLYNGVLIATYIRPEKTAGGIIRPQDSVGEDYFQSKTGMVIGLGPMAFKDDDVNKFYGQQCKVGDWVAFFVSDAKLLNIKDVPCRLIEDSAIKMKVLDPAIVF